EKWEEVLKLFVDLRTVGCNYLSIGQFLAPSRVHYPVQEYIQPEKFNEFREVALKLGFDHVESGPYVRSSYHAGQYA
ncbi:MAG: lipoyl synthase, partial [Deltaproteobacteria bacterium]